MNKYENESGYESECETDCKTGRNYCRFCNKTISGPRIGFVVHLGSIHTDQPLMVLSKETTGTELHKVLAIRKRVIDRVLND